jgi:lipopolysaccharide export system permease protein
MCSTVSHQIEIHAPSRNRRLIVFRYLSREVLTTTFAVTAILLLIIVSTRLIGYLTDAATGELDTAVILDLVVNRIPLILELLLPLGFFLGILLAYGRLYLESEMVVLKACGAGPWRLIGYAIGPALLVATVVASISLYLTPAGMHEAKRIVAEQRSRSELDMLVPGVFQVSNSNSQVSYARKIDEAGNLVDLFVSGRDQQGRSYLLVAGEGQQRFIEKQGRFLVFNEGYRYNFPESFALEEIGFEEYGLKIDDPELSVRVDHLDAIPTLDLIGSDKSAYVSRLHWRLSLPFIPIIVVLLAVQLAKTSPRQGRYAKLIPAILIYQIYIGSLTAARSAVEQGDAGSWMIWFVHLIALGAGVNMVLYEGAWERFMNRLPKIPALLFKNKEAS